MIIPYDQVEGYENYTYTPTLNEEEDKEDLVPVSFAPMKMREDLSFGESLLNIFTGPSQQATSSYSSAQTLPSSSSKIDPQTKAEINGQVGGWFLGLVLGIIAYRIVRPKAKCTTPLEMARRSFAWGLLVSMPPAMTYFFRHSGVEGIAGGGLTVCFFSGAAWVLGLVWGALRFRLFPKIVSASGSLDGEADKEIKLENLPGIREAAARGQAREQYLLGLCYYEGKGVVKNQVEAYKWMLLAQANGFEKARKLSAKMEKALSRSEVAEGQKLATQMQQG
jgi:hypothetical protein